jgi:phospholipase/carboxylesterase
MLPAPTIKGSMTFCTGAWVTDPCAIKERSVEGQRRTMTSGLHHVTLITRKIQANVDFYAGFLGLRLVKRTAGFEDATQLHLFYGDARATPGSLVTFLAWEDGSLGRVGHGAPSEIGLAIRPDAIGFWLTRALKFGFATTGPMVEFGEPVLRLTDPDGVIVKLVGVRGDLAGEPWTGSGIAATDAILNLRGVTLLSEKADETIAFLTRHFGFATLAREGAQTRLASAAGGAIDVRDATGFWPAAPGTGTIDHVALRALDRPAVEAAAGLLAEEDHGAVNAHDRKYFYSLYVREPGGALIEFASDGPGFLIDEPVETLGEALFVPAHFRLDEADARVMLPQFGLPGEPRTIYRDLPFVHRIHEPDEPDGSTLILLHGTGGNETSLLPLARRMAPAARLIGLRGRSTEEGVARFFRRTGSLVFDQKDIVAEAEALAAFIGAAAASYGLDPERMTFIGHSNGANMLGAAMLLHPAAIRRAILLRPMKVLDDAGGEDLEGCAVLIVLGEADPYASHAGTLEQDLRTAGATVTLRATAAGHELVADDIDAARDWLEGPAKQG